MSRELLEKIQDQGGKVDLASGTDAFALAIHSSLLCQGLTYIGGEYSEGSLLFPYPSFISIL